MWVYVLLRVNPAVSRPPTMWMTAVSLLSRVPTGNRECYLFVRFRNRPFLRMTPRWRHMSSPNSIKFFVLPSTKTWYGHPFQTKVAKFLSNKVLSMLPVSKIWSSGIHLECATKSWCPKTTSGDPGIGTDGVMGVRIWFQSGVWRLQSQKAYTPGEIGRLWLLRSSSQLRTTSPSLANR
jgi:hypothetical protein